MYHYADRPGLSTERSRQAIARDYNTSIYGLPGNDGSYLFLELARIRVISPKE